MDGNLEKLLTKIEFPVELKKDFVNAVLTHISRKRDNSKCLFNISVDRYLPYSTYLKLLELVRKTFSEIDEVNIEIIIKEYTDDECLSILKDLIENNIEKYSSNPVVVENDVITISVGNIVEKKDLDLELQSIFDTLRLLGFSKYKYEIKVEKSLNEEISKEIEADRTRPVEFVEKPVVEKNETPKYTRRPRRVFRIDDERVIMGEVIENDAVTLLRTVPDNQYDKNLNLFADVTVEAKVFGFEIIESKKRPGLRIATLKITDETSSIYAKTFIDGDENFDYFVKNVKEGKWYKFKGAIKYDEYAKEITFSLTDINTFEKIENKRKDEANEKRVELHTHTMMSQMDGVADETALVKQAIAFGHPGIAITDHDCCQSFPHVFSEVTSYNKDLKKKAQGRIDELNKTLEELKNANEPTEEIEKQIKDAEEAKKNLKFFKAGYGTELELCEDYLNVCFNANDLKIADATFVVFDTETTGFNPGLGDSMIEIGGVKVKDGEVIDRFDELINPGHHIDEEITNVTDISDDDVKDADNEENVTKRFKEWIGDLPLVAHNARFDKNMLDMAYFKYDLGPLSNPIIDTLMLSRVINRDLKKHSLAALGKAYGIDTGEVDEDEEEVNESSSSRVSLDADLGNKLESIILDGEDILITEKIEYTEADIATESRVTKFKNNYFLKVIHKASKTETVKLEINAKEKVNFDVPTNIKLHPAENVIEVKYDDGFGTKKFEIIIYVGQHHGADVDSENTGYIFNKMLNQIKGIETLNDLNNLALLEDVAFRNNPKLMDHISEVCSYKNYIKLAEPDCDFGYPFLKYDNKNYQWKFVWCNDNNLQMYENIPGKTLTENLANIYDSVKHITFIAVNKTGLKNMFKIVSYANTNFIQKNARIPRKLVEQNREGLLIGSACLNGEIFDAALTRTDADLVEKMKFYDYIEVQPPENYMHLLRNHDLSNQEQLYEAIRKIIRCAKKANKLVVATGDVHHINAGDRIYREIIVNQNVPGKGRHPLARYLAGYAKANNNDGNISKCIAKCEANNIELNDTDIKVLKYVYVLTKVKKIIITPANIANIYVPSKKEENLKGKEGEEEKLRVVFASLRKFVNAGVLKNNENVYELCGNYMDSDDVEVGHIPNQYFRTTDEMKEEFKFLNDDSLIYEIVVTNPNKILDMIEPIEVVVYPDKPFSPIIEHSQETCRDLVFAKAHSMYGDPLPRNIEDRIAQEFYGDKIDDLVMEKINLDHPEMTDEEKQEYFTKFLHEVIMSGYDGVVKLKADQIKRNNAEINDDDAITQAKAELSGIIGGGFDVIYLIAQKLVKHSNDDGYLVGSRGSVGSSFVASMMGITECNGLPPHYYCPACQFSMFSEEDGSKFSYVDSKTGETEVYLSGFDLPERNCPKCGTKMIHQGNDMPFATFLGFSGEKVPDIDLNFSGDNQASAHDYTKVLFGTDNVYRAGTIGTVADKTAFGYVQGYYEETLHNILKTEAASYGLQVAGKDELKKKGIIKSFMRIPEVERISVGCTGVKRTTGQHPGGIVVVPGYKDIWDFTPFQYPADDPTSVWRTTHFDYHAIDADLLKLDILGHDDPTVLRMLQDISGIDVTTIDLGDLDTMKIFAGPEILGVDRYRLRGSVDKDGRKYCPTGTLGVPEFGTSFLLGMLEETKPTTFAELIKISGLSHGTDVWLGNARDLCTPDENGVIKVPFKNVIGCRDDIMVNLIAWGMKPAKAFKIMEFVRKGKASKDPAGWADHAAYMKENNIPDWYIDSCQKIKYMFPKAHATAYVTSAFRIAWFKVHHPIWYYCAYLSIRRDQFDIESMIKGEDAIREKIDEIDAKDNPSNKDADTRETLLLCLEMCCRGFYFKNIDVDKSDGKKFIITEDEKGLIIPFRALDGLGENVAASIVKAREKGPFISIEDLMNRGHINGTSVEKLRELGCLDDLPESNQLSLF